MELLKLKRVLDELTVGTYAYQMRASRVIESWLSAHFKPETAENYVPRALSLKGNESTKITVRIREKPPSLQIIHYPIGGVRAGINRMCEKILKAREESSSGITIVHNEDLTRETIILTLEDTTTDEILEHKLLMPEELASLFAAAKEFQPKLFITIHRSLMGIEQQDGQKIPFHLIENGDNQTWDYLEKTLVVSRISGPS